MKIFRAKANSKVQFYNISFILCLILTIIGIMYTVNYYKIDTDISSMQSADPKGLILICITTVIFFIGVIMFAKASGIKNHEKLNVFAMDEEGELYRVFYTMSDVGGNNFTYMPATTGGKVSSIIKSTNAIININEKGDFLKSETLAAYIEGILTGEMDSSNNVRIHHIENPFIKISNGKYTEFYYTVGKHMQILEMTIFSSHEQYQVIIDWLKKHATNQNYDGKKAGEFLNVK